MHFGETIRAVRRAHLPRAAQRRLRAAQRDAAEHLFACVNSAASAAGAEGGGLLCDMHGLHLPEARANS